MCTPKEVVGNSKDGMQIFEKGGYLLALSYTPHTGIQLQCHDVDDATCFSHV